MCSQFGPYLHNPLQKGGSMLTLIEVECPHCHAKGHVMMPPMGVIVIGPCPECDQMILIFSGKTLALDDAIINNGTKQQKCDHILEVMMKFLREKIEGLVDKEEKSSEKTLSKEEGHNFTDDLDDPEFFKTL